MRPTQRSLLSLFKACIKAGILAGCLVFLYYQIDFTATRNALAQYSFTKSIALSLWFLTSFFFMGIRLYVIGQGQIRVKDTISAVFLGFFSNSIFPARIGEAVKCLYLKLASKKPASRIITIVFWERFSDLNMMLILILLASFYSNTSRYLYPFLAVVLPGWALLLWVHLLFRDNDEKIQKIRFLWVQKPIRHLSTRPAPVTILKLLVLNLLVWAQFILEMLIAIYWIAGFSIPLSSAITVFIISSLAFALPASPGGVGVYDAAIVFAMGRYGVPAGDAMALAILMRTIQYIPTLIIGCIMVIAGGRQLQDIIRPSFARSAMPSV